MTLKFNTIVKIGIVVILLLCLLIWLAFKSQAEVTVEDAYPRIELSRYGSLDADSIQNTFQRAVNDLNGRKLIVPAMKISLGKLDILQKSNFEIEFLPGGEVNCESFRLIDCSNFDFHGMHLKGTKEKFAIFDVIGFCYNFSIHDCLFDSEKDDSGENTFYGIHVHANWYMENRKYENSPHNFKISNNIIRNTKFDGILVHAHCSGFEIENNIVEDAKCIGIEIEGRYGGWKNTTVHPCKNAVIRNNKITRCVSGWGMLLMWADSVIVENNTSKDAYGSFLTIGSNNVQVRKNIFEGKVFGFEVSQEFYKIDNGINSNIVIEDNDIVARPRSNGRGSLDIRHATNVKVRNNRIHCLDNANSACISVASSQNIQIENNKFICNSGIDNRVIIDDVNDPETGKSHPELSVKNVDIRNNVFSGVRKVNSIKVGDLSARRCHIE